MPTNRELTKLDLRLNEANSRIVDLGQGEAFGFLGFDFRRVRSLRGRWRPQYTPKLTQRTALLEKLKERFRRYDSQPVGRVITEINRARSWKQRIQPRGAYGAPRQSSTLLSS